MSRTTSVVMRARACAPGFTGARCAIALAASLLVQAASAGELGPYTGESHDALIRQAKSTTDVAGAIEQLHAWELNPNLKDAQRLRVRADLVALDQRAGQAKAALDVARSAGYDKLPDYALESAFAASRQVRDLAAEHASSEELLRRHPDDPRAAIRRFYVLLDEQKLDDAERVLVSAEEQNRKKEPPREIRLETLQARLALSDARADDWGALVASSAILELSPGDAHAQRRRAYATAGQGGASSALAMANTPAFSDEDRAALAQQAEAQQLRWALGGMQYREPAHRFDDLDALLKNIDDQIAALDGKNMPDERREQIRHALQFDKISALNRRGRYREAADLHEQLVAANVDEPWYALAAAAGSYQQLQQSPKAVPLYEAALQKGGSAIPVPSDIHEGLVYAYMDTGHFDKADALLDQLEAATPPRLARAPLPDLANPQYADVELLRSQIELYTDRTKAAQQRIDRLSELAPGSAPIRSTQAQMLMLREHPEASLERYRRTLTDHPDSLDARSGYAVALFDADRYREGRQITDQLEQDYPENASVRYAERIRDAIYAPLLTLSADVGGGAGAVADHEWHVDGRFDGPVMDDKWRLFVDRYTGLGKTDIGNYRRARTGVGASWTWDRWEVEGQVTQADHGDNPTGGAAQVDYRASDHWRLSASADSNSNDVPWKAYLTNVTGAEYNAGATYVVNESRQFALQTGYMKYSDDNEHETVGLTWDERWYSGPRWQFATSTGIEAGHSADDTVAYYSPKADASASVEGHLQFLTWKSDERVFTQHLYAGGGAYQEDGFGTGGTWDVRYEHQWSFRERFRLQYGAGLLSHPYDGDNERRHYGYLSLAVPFL